SQARSAMATSTFLMVIAGWLMARTHPASQGAGHKRPVNSGKLLVACSRSLAARQSSRETRSFHSGMRFPSGQASWQNGIPPSVQRLACLLMIGSNAPGTYPSSQSRPRSSTGLRGHSSRGVLMNPLGSAMAVSLAYAYGPASGHDTTPPPHPLLGAG